MHLPTRRYCYGDWFASSCKTNSLNPTSSRTRRWQSIYPHAAPCCCLALSNPAIIFPRPYAYQVVHSTARAPDRSTAVHIHNPPPPRYQTHKGGGGWRVVMRNVRTAAAVLLRVFNRPTGDPRPFFLRLKLPHVTCYLCTSSKR